MAVATLVDWPAPSGDTPCCGLWPGRASTPPSPCGAVSAPDHDRAHPRHRPRPPRARRLPPAGRRPGPPPLRPPIRRGEPGFFVAEGAHVIEPAPRLGPAGALGAGRPGPPGARWAAGWTASRRRSTWPTATSGRWPASTSTGAPWPPPTAGRSPLRRPSWPAPGGWPSSRASTTTRTSASCSATPPPRASTPCCSAPLLRSALPAVGAGLDGPRARASPGPGSSPGRRPWPVSGGPASPSPPSRRRPDAEPLRVAPGTGRAGRPRARRRRAGPVPRRAGRRRPAPADPHAAAHGLAQRRQRRRRRLLRSHQTTSSCQTNHINLNFNKVSLLANTVHFGQDLPSARAGGETQDSTRTDGSGNEAHRGPAHAGPVRHRAPFRRRGLVLAGVVAQVPIPSWATGSARADGVRSLAAAGAADPRRSAPRLRRGVGLRRLPAVSRGGLDDPGLGPSRRASTPCGSALTGWPRPGDPGVGRHQPRLGGHHPLDKPTAAAGCGWWRAARAAADRVVYEIAEPDPDTRRRCPGHRPATAYAYPDRSSNTEAAFTWDNHLVLVARTSRPRSTSSTSCSPAASTSPATSASCPTPTASRWPSRRRTAAGWSRPPTTRCSCTATGKPGTLEGFLNQEPFHVIVAAPEDNVEAGDFYPAFGECTDALRLRDPQHLPLSSLAGR